MKRQIRTIVTVALATTLVLSTAQLDAAPPRNGAATEPPTVAERAERASKRIIKRIVRALGDLPMPPIPPPCTGNC